MTALDARGSGSGDGAGGDGAVSTGPIGPRFATRYDDQASQIAGANGRLAMVVSFGGTFNADGVPAMSGAGYTNSAVLTWDTDGTVLSHTLLENDGFCDMRGLTLDGTDVVLAGYAEASNALPQYGPCGVLASRQQPVLIRVEPATGALTSVAQWNATGINGQAWRIVRMSDGTFAHTGIYGQNLTVGSTVLPTATADPSLWIARTKPSAANDASWATAVVPANQAYPGPIASDGDEVCVVGSNSSPANVFGTALPFVGGTADAFVARLDANGNAKFVRAIGSTGNESSYGDGSVIATADGGCIVGLTVPGDVTLDSVAYPASAGIGLEVQFSSSGKVVNARRFPTDIYVTLVGSRLIGFYQITAPTMIGSVMDVPAGKDAVLVELGATPAQDVLLGSVGGGGDQDAFGLVTVGPDAVAFMVQSTGGLSFGTTSFDTGTGSRAVGVLGI